MAPAMQGEALVSSAPGKARRLVTMPGRCMKMMINPS
jgi:hypothetical protein